MNRNMQSNHSLRSQSPINSSAAPESVMNFVDKRINDLKQEEAAILQVCTKLSQFLQANSITPFNDDILEYLRYFIREENLKQNAGANNAEVIRGLENLVAEYTQEMELFKRTLNVQKTIGPNSNDPNSVRRIDEVFKLVETLYALPINGQQIRQQVDGLKRLQTETRKQREYDVILPACASFSTIMKQLQEVVS
jgi:hypothetical protein